MDQLVICNPSDRLEVARWQLLTKVRAAIKDMPPEVAQSAVGIAVQTGVLIEAAASMLAEQTDATTAHRLLREMVERFAGSRRLPSRRAAEPSN